MFSTRSRPAVLGLALVLVSGALTVTPAAPAAAASAGGLRGPSQASTPTGTVKPGKAAVASPTAKNASLAAHRQVPAGGTGSVPLSGAITTVGGLGVGLKQRAAATSPAGAAGIGSMPETSEASGGAVSVTVAAPAVAKTLGVSGVVVTLQQRPGMAGRVVTASIDDTSFASLYGGDYANRLHLIELPACALTTPSVRACQTQTSLASANEAGTVSADIVLPGTSTVTDAAMSQAVAAPAVVLAAVAGQSSNGETYTATSLSEAYSWAAGNQAGSFSTSIPLPVPASLGGPKPDLSLDYDSGGVDAKTLSQNGQTSWVGEGWDLGGSGYIEQSFRSCSQDGGTTGDLCQFSPDNATMVFRGQAVRLVLDSSGVWHGSSDSAIKIDRVLGTGAANTPGSNGTQNHEYWRVTTQDGTQYYFGINHRYAGDTAQTLSTQWEPVFGNNTGEQCHASTFAASVCQVGYRWNLDYVVDTSGNSMTYNYAQLMGHVGTNGNTRVLEYVVTDTPTEINYGTRAGTEATTSAPLRVEFGDAYRCTGACVWGTSDYPDTPWDLYCSSTTSCPNVLTPTYWTEYRLSTVTTEIWRGTYYHSVDEWDLTHTYPSTGDFITPTGDDTSPNLWLNTITHIGWAPDSTTLTNPTVTFGGTRMANQVLWGNNIHVAPYMHYRITSIDNGMGGTTDVTYNGIPCTSTDVAGRDPSSNGLKCFPQSYPNQQGVSTTSWFNKYTVASVAEHDATGGSPDEVWAYAYSTAHSSTNVLWHYDYGETAPASGRTWDEFAGFSDVTVTHGDGTSGDPTTVTKDIYLRGLDNDATINPTTHALVWNSRRVTASDSQASGIVDHDGLQGMLLEEQTLDGSPTAAMLATTLHTYTVTQTADRAAPETGGNDWYAYMVTDTQDKTGTYLPLSSSWRWTETDTAYDTYGNPTLVTDKNDTSISTDDTCEQIWYVYPDTTKWLIDFQALTETTDCATNPIDSDYLSGTETWYDNSDSTRATPTRGLPTQQNSMTSVVSGNTHWDRTSATVYDSYGRVTNSYTGNDNETVTAYTTYPATGGPITGITTEDPEGYPSSVTIDPGHGSTLTSTDINGKVTTEQYDPDGDLTAVWEHNRPTTGTPDLQFRYTFGTPTTPGVVQTSKIGPTGAQISSYDIYGGRLQLRQTQTPGPVANGGRNMVDTAYNSRGLATVSSSFWNSSAPTSTLATFADTSVTSQHRYTYDDQERQTADTSYSNGASEWATTTLYQGDRTTVTPPSGAMPSTTVIDARGNTTELRQYKTTTITGGYDATDYTYDRLGQLMKTVNAAGDAWTNVYDLWGRVISATDPDSGTTTTTYDEDNNPITVTDARGVTLFNVYDGWDRKEDTYLNNTSGTLLAYWGWDDVEKGQLSYSAQVVNGENYYQVVTGYNDAYQPLGIDTSIPEGQGSAIAADWITNYTYNVDGSPATTTYPAAGGLAAETVRTTYDANGNPLTTAGLDAYVSGTEYEPWGDLFQHTLGTGSKRVQVETDEYDDTHWPGEYTVSTERPGSPGTFDNQFQQLYDWNHAGQVTGIEDETNNGTVVSASQCFSYDYLQRLTTAFTITPANGNCNTTPSASVTSGPAPYWQTYSYDSTGNRSAMVTHGLGGVANTSSTYTYPTLGTTGDHRLTSVATTAPGGNTSNHYTYNPAGDITNMTVAGLSTDFTQNSRNELSTVTIHATGGNQTTTYYDDANGNEILRATPTSKTLYLGNTDITTNAAGTAITGVTRYYSQNGVVVASRNNPGTLSWIANTDQGTAQVAVDQTSLAVTVRRLDPFGNSLGTPPSWPNPRGYVGGTTEPDTLVHLGARMYDPTTGRFTSDDPVNDTGDPQQLNGYAYAENNPITMSDSSGLDSCATGGQGCKIDPTCKCYLPPGGGDIDHRPTPRQPGDSEPPVVQTSSPGTTVTIRGQITSVTTPSQPVITNLGTGQQSTVPGALTTTSYYTCTAGKLCTVPADVQNVVCDGSAKELCIVYAAGIGTIEVSAKGLITDASASPPWHSIDASIGEIAAGLLCLAVEPCGGAELFVVSVAGFDLGGSADPSSSVAPTDVSNFTLTPIQQKYNIALIGYLSMPGDPLTLTGAMGAAWDDANGYAGLWS
jgi:RHS repeat-associated protein